MLTGSSLQANDATDPSYDDEIDDQEAAMSNVTDYAYYDDDDYAGSNLTSANILRCDGVPSASGSLNASNTTSAEPLPCWQEWNDDYIIKSTG